MSNLPHTSSKSNILSFQSFNHTAAQGYRWSNDPEASLLYQVRIAINNANLSAESLSLYIFQQSHQTVHRRTILSLLDGKTKHPHLRTVLLIMQSLGYPLTFTAKAQ